MKYNINWEEKLPSFICNYASKNPDLLHPAGILDIFTGETNILNDAGLIFKWPHPTIMNDYGSMLNPNTDVLVERGKKVCSAFFG